MSEPAVSDYPFDTENVAEMARLTRQARVITEAVGLLPTEISLSAGRTALDVGCGPGQWVLALAERYTGVDVTGIDISQMMTSYAAHMAAEAELPSVHFKILDACQPLNFPDASFDLVQARAVAGFMTPQLWPRVLRECARVLKPGGYFIGVEGDDMGNSSSSSLSHLCDLMMQALHRSGHGFTESEHYFGIVALYPRLLREAGLTSIKREAFVLDYSAGTTAHPEMTQDLAILFQLAVPFLTRATGISASDLSALRERAIEDMQASDFCAAGFLQRVWAVKPAESA